MNMNYRDLGIEPKQIVLLILDPQVDFHEACKDKEMIKKKTQQKDGSLSVPGSYEDAQRTTEFILNNRDDIGEIFITLDSHHKKHIAHKAFWSNIRHDTDNKGKMPSDYDVITYESLKASHEGDNTAVSNRDGKRWFPRDASLENYVLEYTYQLEKVVRSDGDKFQLTIWPDHCLIGSEGHAIQEDIQKAIREWDINHLGKVVKYIYKGMNCLTEMYSAIRAEVPVSNDETTLENKELLMQFKECKKLIVCGQALSHVVKLTVMDILDHWEKNNKKAEDMIILKDCSSSVYGFKDKGDSFLQMCERRGVTVMTSKMLISK